MRLLAFLLALPLLFLAIACSGDDDDAGSGQLRVVATTTQIGDFARNVGGYRISLTVLLKPNQDAHDFEPEPSQLRALTQADVVLRNGIGLDAFVSKTLQSSSNKVIVVTEGIDLLDGEEHEDAGEHDEDAEAEAGGHDPHVWFSAANARAMVENIRDALIEADETNADYYRENASNYLASLVRLDAGIRTDVGAIPVNCRKLVTNHDVLHYYAEAYGFEVVGAVIPATTTGAQASAADVAEIVGLIRSERVPAIFAEASVNPALVQQVGREAGVRVVDDLYGDSLGEPGSDGGTYIEMMEANTAKIVEGLKGCLG